MKLEADCSEELNYAKTTPPQLISSRFSGIFGSAWGVLVVGGAGGRFVLLGRRLRGAGFSFLGGGALGYNLMRF